MPSFLPWGLVTLHPPSHPRPQLSWVVRGGGGGLCRYESKRGSCRGIQYPRGKILICYPGIWLKGRVCFIRPGVGLGSSILTSPQGMLKSQTALIQQGCRAAMLRCGPGGNHLSTLTVLRSGPAPTVPDLRGLALGSWWF